MALGALASAAALAPAPAGAAEFHVVSGGLRYLTGNASCATDLALCTDGRLVGAEVLRVRIPEGSTLRYTNLELFGHDLRSVKSENGRPLFSTPRVNAGTVPVTGIPENVEAGKSYPFICTFHPPRGDGSGMLGVLEIVDAPEVRR